MRMQPLATLKVGSESGNYHKNCPAFGDWLIGDCITFHHCVESSGDWQTWFVVMRVGAD